MLNLKKSKPDNLFDSKLTMLDVVKVLLLIVSLFSTWNIVDIITPDGPFAWVRILACVGVVEGALVAFELATKNSKTERQSKLATLGYFCSLIVIGTFFFVSGFLEFSGPSLLSTPLGDWLGINWTVHEVVLNGALLVIGSWLVLLSSIAFSFWLADPDKKAELERNQIDGNLKLTSNAALAQALGVVGPEIAIQRTLLSITETYGPELTPLQLTGLLQIAELKLREFYSSAPAGAVPSLSLLLPPVPAPAPVPPTSTPAPSPIPTGRRPIPRVVPRPARPKPVVMAPVPVLSTASGNGHHKNPTP